MNRNTFVQQYKPFLMSCPFVEIQCYILKFSTFKDKLTSDNNYMNSVLSTNLYIIQYLVLSTFIRLGLL